jgi:hypothetical protein
MLSYSDIVFQRSVKFLQCDIVKPKPLYLWGFVMLAPHQESSLVILSFEEHETEATGFC